MRRQAAAAFVYHAVTVAEHKTGLHAETEESVDCEAPFAKREIAALVGDIGLALDHAGGKHAELAVHRYSRSPRPRAVLAVRHVHASGDRRAARAFGGKWPKLDLAGQPVLDRIGFAVGDDPRVAEARAELQGHPAAFRRKRV